jgi:hypothetical protein
MGNRTRARGNREPTGRTKSAILLFLADNGESTFTQVRVRLQEQYNIKSTKDVKLHLADLSADDGLALIEKVSHGSGNANSYRIRPGFNGLKRLHNYLDRYDAVPALMRTKYFREYTVSRDFDTRVRTNLVRNQMLELYEGMLDDRDYPKIKALLKGVCDEDRAAMIAWMDRVRAGDRDDALSGGFLAMVDMWKEGDIDRLTEIYLGLVQQIGAGDTPEALNDFFALMSELGVPGTHVDWVAARQMSPGALDYLLNSSKNNRLFPPNVFLAYVFSLVLGAPGGVFIPGELPLIDFGKFRRYTALLPRYAGASPIRPIVRALFIADMVSGRLIIDEVPEETLRLIFS